MQLRHESQLTAVEYVKQKAWEGANLQQCPLHPEGGCGIARHGTYGRVEPVGMEVARWYCKPGHTTFSLLPDCLAAKLSSTLAAIETVMDAVEQRESSLEAVAEKLRADIGEQHDAGGVGEELQPHQLLNGRAVALLGPVPVEVSQRLEAAQAISRSAVSCLASCCQ